MISAIVLAAGEAKRMGRLKQLLPFGDSTLIEGVVSNILESGVSEIIVVLGHQAERIAPLIAAKPLKVVINPDYREGLSSSIRCGLDHTAKESDAFMIFLGDQPLIGREIINRLVDEFARGRYGIIAPVYKGERGHPVIFAAKYRTELSRLEGDTGAKEIVKAHPKDVQGVEVGSESILLDINTENDYHRQLKTTSASGY